MSECCRSLELEVGERGRERVCSGGVKRMGSMVAWRFVIRWFEQMVCGTREIIILNAVVLDLTNRIDVYTFNKAVTHE